MALRHLRFDRIAPGRDFHAALAADFPRRADAALHTHDFSEAMYVLDGAGMHALNGTDRVLRAGDLLWIRPQDRHGFYAPPGQKMHFINIAFRQALWSDFRRLALDAPGEAAWETTPDPPAVHVQPAQRGESARLFRDMLLLFHARPTRLALCRFWGELLPLLAPPAIITGTLPGEPAGPAWLARACLALHSEDALRAGVPRLVELCGVSPAHLARTLKASQGRTPTEFVNALRLEHAAMLLATTTQEIGGVAADCGFENLSYFYRLFRARFGSSPRRYRLGARQAVLP